MSTKSGPIFFYTDPRIAGYMHETFDMRFIDNFEISEMYMEGVLHKATRPAKIIIHPDSLHLLEPVIGDLVTNIGMSAWRVLTIFGDLLMCPDNYFARKKDVSIIWRNGRTFHWPEREAV